METLASVAAIEQHRMTQQERIAELERDLEGVRAELATCMSERAQCLRGLLDVTARHVNLADRADEEKRQHTDRAAEQERRSADLAARAAEQERHQAELTQRNAGLAARVDERDCQTVALQTLVDEQRGSNADLQRIVYEQGVRCLDLQRQSEDVNEMARQLEAAHCYIDILETDRRDEHAKRRRIESGNEVEQVASVEAPSDEIHDEEDQHNGGGDDEENVEEEDVEDDGKQYHLTRTLMAAGSWWSNEGVVSKYVATKHRKFDVFLTENGLPPIGRIIGSGPGTGFVVTVTQAHVIFRYIAQTSRGRAWCDQFAALVANRSDFLECLQVPLYA